MILKTIIQSKEKIVTLIAMLSLVGCAATQPYPQQGGQQYTYDSVTGQPIPVSGGTGYSTTTGGTTYAYPAGTTYVSGGYPVARTVAATAAGVALGAWAYDEWDDDDDDWDDYNDQRDDNWDQASENYRNAQQKRQENFRNAQSDRQNNRQERFHQRQDNRSGRQVQRSSNQSSRQINRSSSQGNRQMMRQERRSSVGTRSMPSRSGGRSGGLRR